MFMCNVKGVACREKELSKDPAETLSSIERLSDSAHCFIFSSCSSQLHTDKAGDGNEAAKEQIRTYKQTKAE